MKISFKSTLFNFFRRIFKLPLLEKSLVKLTLNRPFSDTVIKFIPNNYMYKKETWRYAKRNGINYKLDLYDYIDWWIYFGIVDPDREKLYNLVSANDTVIDVGTNVGETLMNFANLTAPLGCVHGFEPDTINYKRCLENLSLNNFHNINLNHVGLGDTNTQLNLKVDTLDNRGKNRIAAYDPNSSSELIQVITLDSYITDKKIQRIDLVKIDVEGYEFKVLKGFEHSLKKFKPVLFIELDDNNLKHQGSSARELINYLFDLNYTISNSETNLLLDTTSVFINCHFDILCKPN